MKNQLSLIFVAIYLFACSSKPIGLVFEKQEPINFTELDFPIPIGIGMQLIKIGDNLLINDFRGDSLISVFNLHSHKIDRYLIAVGNGPNEMQSPLNLQLSNEKLYIYCRPRFNCYHLPSDSLDTKNITPLVALPQKGDLFLPLTDSVFIFSGMWDKRYALVNIKNNEIKEFGEYPNFWKDEASIPTRTKFMFHQSMFAKHPTEYRFVSCSNYVLEIYQYDPINNSTQLQLQKQLQNYSYKYEVEQEGILVAPDATPQSGPKVKFVTCTNDYIYMVCESDQDRKVHNIMVVDWAGKPIKQLTINKHIACITIDEPAQKAYLIVNDPDPKLGYVDIKE